MRPPITIAYLALVLFMGQVTGCVSFQSVSPDPLATELPGLEVGKRYRFTLSGGHQETLYFLRSDSIAIAGQVKKNTWEVRSVQLS